MHVTDRSKTVVMLIDWDNLQICHSRDAPGTDLDLQALIALAQSYGTLVSARAYAEWNLLSERLAVYKAGIEPVFAPVMRPEGSPREGKSLADTVMVADGVDLLWTVAPDVFVLATSDKDMIPLARIAKQRGAAVVVLGSDLTAIPLVEMSNVFITYRQLLRELDRVSELEAPVGRAPARERRLRESRRPSSEPYGGGLWRAAIGGPIGAGGTDDRPFGGHGDRQRPPPTPLPPSRAPAAIRRADCARPVAAETRACPPAPTRAGRAGDRCRRPAIRRGRDRCRRRRAAPSPSAGRTRSADGTRRGRRRRHPGRGLQDMSTTRMRAMGRRATGRAAASAASPDDIDSAVLQLLASRDRTGAARGADEASARMEPAAASPARPVLSPWQPRR